MMGEQLSLRNVARLADGWHCNSSMDKYAHKLDVLRGYCDEYGRDVDTIAKFHAIHAIYDRDEASANRRANLLSERNDKLRDLRHRIVADTGDKLLDYMRGYVKLGCRNFIMYYSEPHRHVENITGFGEELIPRLQQLL